MLSLYNHYAITLVRLCALPTDPIRPILTTTVFGELFRPVSTA